MTTTDKIPSIDDDEIPSCSPEELGIPPRPREELRKTLNPVELDLYEDWRLKFANWCVYCGRKPYFGKGYSVASMGNLITRVERFAHWIYTHDDFEFTTTFTGEHVNEYWNHIRTNDNQTCTNRRTINNVSTVLKTRGIEYDIPKKKEVYEEIQDERASSFTDYYDEQELRDIRSAATRAFTVPNRENQTNDEIDEVNAELAQRLEKPKSEISEEDWEAQRSYKIPSLVYVSLDIGPRPVEISRMRASGVHLGGQQPCIKIPKSDDSKLGKDNRECVLAADTARVLEKWLDERKQSSEYDDTDLLWLNDEGNPFNKDSLRTLNTKLMGEAQIDTENREQGWYMIRRGVGTEVAQVNGVLGVMQQLRIDRVETAKRYVQNSNKALNKWMGSRW